MELLNVADAVAREKSIEKEEVLQAMEEAIRKAGRSKYGYEQDIRATIDRTDGSIKLQRYREVVETIDSELEGAESTQILLADAKKVKKDAKIGDHLIDDLPPIDFGRIAAQTAKQVITQKVRDAERARQYLEYKDRVGEIINGTVKRVEYGTIMIDLGRAEAAMRKDESIPREHLKYGDRVRAYIYDVREEPRGPQIFVSRSRPDFMTKLFAQEVPEIYDGIIEVKAVARDPGSRAKIAVASKDSTIDPVGACVGMRGSRVQAVVNELYGEKIDIVPWSQDSATFVINALAPAKVSKVVVDEDNHRLDIVVPEDQLSLAIGRRGQNVRLASMLCGWDIDIMTDEEESDRRQQEFQTRSALFMEGLDVDEVIAHLLVAEGFRSIEEISETPVEELSGIEGFDEDVAEELRNRATDHLESRKQQLIETCTALGMSEDLMKISELTPEILSSLGNAGVKTLDDLADLASDELIDIAGEGQISEERANAVIMAARAHWFDEELDEELAEGYENETGEPISPQDVENEVIIGTETEMVAEALEEDVEKAERQGI